MLAKSATEVAICLTVKVAALVAVHLFLRKALKAQQAKLAQNTTTEN